MKHIFILNPVAGKGRTLKLIPDIEKYFADTREDYIIEITGYPGHATEIAGKYASGQPCRIYSVGGDGTLNEVLNGMAESDSILAAIPSGSGNDFIKSIVGKDDLKNILARTIQGKEQQIDIARASDKYFINIASLGFDALVVHRTQHFKKLPFITGKVAYVLGILTAILQRKTSMLDIRLDEDCIRTGTLLIAVGNGRYYGGGMLALPMAEITDGLLDVCLIEGMSRLKILHLFPKFMKGRHGVIKGVHFYKGKKLLVKSTSSIAMNIDGEISLVKEAAFEVIPKALKFVFPDSL